MNAVQLMGRLVKDPQINTSGSGTKMARFTLAVRRGGKPVEGQPDSDFLNCLAFNKTADLVEKYVQKGTLIAVEGNIRTGSYTNREGQKIYTTDIYVNNVHFCGKNENTQSGSTSGQQTAQQTMANVQNQMGGDFMYIPDNTGNDMPFN